MGRRILLPIAVLAFTMSGQAQAAVAVFGKQADYDAATGPQIFVINFNGNPEGGTSVSGDSFGPAVTFGSPEASDPNSVRWSGNAITSDGSATAPNDVGPMNGVFADPVYAFALGFSSTPKAGTVSLYDEGEDLIEAVEAPNASGFFGVLSETPIKSFLIDDGNSPDTANPAHFFIDDFRVNQPPIQVEKKLTEIAYNGTTIGDDQEVPELPEAPLQTRVEFAMVISVTNNSPSRITDVVVKDRLGNELAFVSSVPPPASEPAKDESGGMLLSWETGDLAEAQTAEITLTVATDVNNPGQQAEPMNEYTAAGAHELNSGAKATGLIGETTVSGSSDSFSVLAVEMPDLVVLELQVLGHTEDSITYSYMIRNIGTGPANLDGPTASDTDNVSVQAYLSKDTVFNNAGDTPAGAAILGPSPLGLLNPGQTFSGSFSAAALGTNPADYTHLTLMVDQGQVVAESDETNNTAATLMP